VIQVLLDYQDITNRVINIGSIVHQLEHDANIFAAPTVSIFASDILLPDEDPFSELLDPSTGHTLSILRDGVHIFRGPVDMKSIESDLRQKTCRFRALGDLMTGKSKVVTSSFPDLSDCAVTYTGDPFGYKLPCLITKFMQALGATTVTVDFDATLGGKFPDAVMDDWVLTNASGFTLGTNLLEKSVYDRKVVDTLTLLETLKRLAVAWGAVMYVDPGGNGYFLQRDKYLGSLGSIDQHLMSWRERRWESHKDRIEVRIPNPYRKQGKEVVGPTEFVAVTSTFGTGGKLEVNAEAAMWLRLVTGWISSTEVSDWVPSVHGSAISQWEGFWPNYASYLSDYYYGFYGKYREIVEAVIADPEEGLFLPLKQVSLDGTTYTILESTTNLKARTIKLKLLGEES